MTLALYGQCKVGCKFWMLRADHAMLYAEEIVLASKEIDSMRLHCWEGALLCALQRQQC